MRSPRFDVFALEITFEGATSAADPLAEDFKRLFGGTPDDGDQPDAIDIPIVTDPLTRKPTLRGTSIVGSLRAHLSQYELKSPFRQVEEKDTRARGSRSNNVSRCATLADLVLGSSTQEYWGKTRVLRPSAVRLVSLETTTNDAANDRTRTAISRKTGAAVGTKLFSRQEARIHSIELLLTVDRETLELCLHDLAPNAPTPNAEDLLKLLKSVFHDWAPRLGGQSSLGYGKGNITTVKHREVDLTDQHQMKALVAGVSVLGFMREGLTGVESSHLDDTWVNRPAHQDEKLIDVQFDVVDPLLVDVGEREGNELVSSNRIPSSMWKGVLRSRCEYVLRSCQVKACNSSDEGTCGKCPTCLLFGWTARDSIRERGVDDEDGGRSLLVFTDSKLEGGHRISLAHVAIDRFTGGSRDGSLFVETVIAPPATVSLQIKKRTVVPEWAEALLWMAIRDIHDGLVGIGHSTTRGCGTLRLQDREEFQLKEKVGCWPKMLEGLSSDDGPDEEANSHV